MKGENLALPSLQRLEQLGPFLLDQKQHAFAQILEGADVVLELLSFCGELLLQV